jgi:hypothetical protein
MCSCQITKTNHLSGSKAANETRTRCNRRLLQKVQERKCREACIAGALDKLPYPSQLLLLQVVQKPDACLLCPIVCLQHLFQEAQYLVLHFGQNHIEKSILGNACSSHATLGTTTVL